MVLPEEIRSVFIKLIPFTLSILTYFYGFIPHNDKLLLALTKCLPIVCLLVFIGLYSMDLKAEFYNSSYIWYVKMICLGLLFCLIGDILVIWPITFDFCVVAYMFGLVHYILAFGFQPHAYILGIFCYVIATLVIIFLNNGLDGIDSFLIPAFTIIQLTAIWRACAPFSNRKYWPYIRWSSVFGTITLGFANFIIAVEKFKIHLIYISEFDMVLYYLAQLLITFSVTELHFQTSNPELKSI